MVGLADNGLNGILADDMGLGKTVQVGLGATCAVAMSCNSSECSQCARVSKGTAKPQ